MERAAIKSRKTNQLRYREIDERATWLRRWVVDFAYYVDELPGLVRKHQWSDERVSRFKKVVEAYARKPNIENYLIVRREFPEIEITGSSYGGFGGREAVRLIEKFQEHGINKQVLWEALHGEEQSIDALCLHLMELLIRREKISDDEPGFLQKRSEAISDSTVNYLLAIVLEGLQERIDLIDGIPESLLVLVRLQLCGSNPDLHRLSMSIEMRDRAAWLAAEALRPGERLTVRRLTKILGIKRMTAARLLHEPDFRQAFNHKMNELNALRRSGKIPRRSMRNSCWASTKPTSIP